MAASSEPRRMHTPGSAGFSFARAIIRPCRESCAVRRRTQVDAGIESKRADRCRHPALCGLEPDLAQSPKMRTGDILIRRPRRQVLGARWRRVGFNAGYQGLHFADLPDLCFNDIV